MTRDGRSYHCADCAQTSPQERAADCTIEEAIKCNRSSSVEDESASEEMD